MKKILFAFCLLAISYTCSAQYYYKDPVTFGVKAGANLASVSQTITGLSGSLTNNGLISFNAGAFVNFNLSENVALQPALMFTGKGFKQSGSTSYVDPEFGVEMSASYDLKTSIYYLHVPLNLIYNIEAGYDDEFFFGAGPFVSYGIGGKNTGTTGGEVMGERFDVDVNQKVTFGSGENDIKRTDYGIGAIIGYKFASGFMFNAGYDLGLANIQPASSEEGPSAKTKTRVISLSIGFQF